MHPDDESAQSPPPPAQPKHGYGAVGFAAPKPGHSDVNYAAPKAPDEQPLDVMLHSLGYVAVLPVVLLYLSA